MPFTSTNVGPDVEDDVVGIGHSTQQTGVRVWRTTLQALAFRPQEKELRKVEKDKFKEQQKEKWSQEHTVRRCRLTLSNPR
jgi:hypothetical protein